VSVETPVPAAGWRPTACVLCACNCGVEVQVSGGAITRVKGDRAHPASKGYACEKAQLLPYYQSNPRILSPLRRTPDGDYEEVDWDTAIAEIAGGLARVRDEHGGASIFYYGGGGQGNHLGGAYSGATRSALGVRFSSNALAQEKTGEIWIDAHLFGHVTHTAPDFERAQVAVFLGKNPWQAHGFPHARPTLKAIAADPAQSLIVIDPRGTETAELADIHLRVRPGGDAFLLSAMLAVLVQDDLVDIGFLEDQFSPGGSGRPLAGVPAPHARQRRAGDRWHVSRRGDPRRRAHRRPRPVSRGDHREQHPVHTRCLTPPGCARPWLPWTSAS
jgi:anaerobic selenocysteine-containing dehydrogenase